jgi:uncharacterized protein
MLIPRTLKDIILKDLKEAHKGIVIYGARQVGKTTLANQILSELSLKTLYLNGDLYGDWKNILESRELSKYKLLFTGYEAVFVDEAQRIPNIGISLKIILDNFPNLVVIVTGSSSLDLASKISEPLTGRVYTYKLNTLSYLELSQIYSPIELRNLLEERLIFGSYPQAITLEGMDAKVNYLSNLTNSYLYKDLLEFGDIKNSSKIADLLKLLSFQVGCQVSIAELAKSLELSRNTVDRYIDLLEQSFIIYRLSGFSRNLRKEVSKMDKIYFYDLGVRNTIMGNLNLIGLRDDIGRLWENFLINERIKITKLKSPLTSFYYWRLSSGAELDLVEDSQGKLGGYEFKWGSKESKAPASWINSYDNATFSCYNRDNFEDFILN